MKIWTPVLCDGSQAILGAEDKVKMETQMSCRHEEPSVRFGVLELAEILIRRTGSVALSGL